MRWETVGYNGQAPDREGGKGVDAARAQNGVDRVSAEDDVEAAKAQNGTYVGISAEGRWCNEGAERL